MEEFDKIYRQLLTDIMANGDEEYNSRTKSYVKRKFGISFILHDVNTLPMISCRKTYPKTAAAEFVWSISGETDTTWLKKYTKIWEQFEDSKDNISFSYGFRWRHKFNRDQLFDAIDALKKDPSSRQCVIMAWDPADDGLLNIGNKNNVPCPYSFVLTLINGKLNMMVTIRSSDLILGLPYDVMMYSLLNFGLSMSLKCQPGDIMFSIADCHIYEYLYNTVYIMQNIELYDFGIIIPKWDINEILDNKDNYVQYFALRSPVTNVYNPNLKAIK